MTPEIIEGIQKIAGKVDRFFKGSFDDAFQAAVESWLTQPTETPLPLRWSRCYYATLRAGALFRFDSLEAYHAWYRSENRESIRLQARISRERDKLLRVNRRYVNGRWSEEPSREHKRIEKATQSRQVARKTDDETPACLLETPAEGRDSSCDLAIRDQPRAHRGRQCRAEGKSVGRPTASTCESEKDP